MSPSSGPILSLVIPCFNEAENLPRLFQRCVESFGNLEDTEVIFVNNGSSDNTQEILSELTELHHFFSIVKVDVNQGYGFGILAGLKAARGEILAWTHADFQTDPADAIEGLRIFTESPNPQNLFVKGRRFGRPLFDVFFTVAMSLFQLITLKVMMTDINAQPTMFHRTLFEKWQNPPHDFSLDLFVFYHAKLGRLSIQRFPVRFGERAYGEAHLKNLKAKINYSLQTIRYSQQIKKTFFSDPNRVE